MKKLLIIMLVLGLGLMMLPTLSQADTNVYLFITVSVSTPSDITVVNYTTVSNWDILNKSFSFITNRDVATIVSNSSAANESFRLAVESYGNFGTDGWANSTTTTNGVNTYVLQALFSGTSEGQPSTNTNWYAADDVVIFNPKTATGSVFASLNFTTNASNVPNGGKRNLWMKFKIPTSGIAHPVQPTCRLIISAQIQ